MERPVSDRPNGLSRVRGNASGDKHYSHNPHSVQYNIGKVTETMDDKFQGFDIPRENWSKLPHIFFDAWGMIETHAELRVILYIIRHTWGFSEYETPKKITLDEFMNGRKLKDGSRMDMGTGLSKPSVINGLKRAVAHGFVLTERDDADKAREKVFYIINMSGLNSFTPDVKNFNTSGKESLQRSEKETKKEKKKDIPAAPRAPRKSKPRDTMFDAIMELSFGVTPGDKALEKIHGGRVGVVKAAIVAAGYSEEQYRLAVKRFKEHFPKGTVPKGASSVVGMIQEHGIAKQQKPRKLANGMTQDEFDAAVAEALSSSGSYTMQDFLEDNE